MSGPNSISRLPAVCERRDWLSDIFHHAPLFKNLGMPPIVLNNAREQWDVYLIHQVVFFNGPVCKWFQLVRVTKQDILGTIFRPHQ